MTREPYPSELAARFMLRLPEYLHEQIKADAAANNRSMNAEIVARLQGAPSNAALTPAQLADALNCFWNAAIGDAHNRQSSTAMDAASVMAEGLAAVAARLNEIGGAS